MKPEVKNISAGKSGTVTSQIKPVLTDQQHRLHAKHGHDVDLMDDLRNFIKVRCNIEKDYAQALIKLTNSSAKIRDRYPAFALENESDVKSLYTAWKTYIEEVDRMAKQRLAEFDQVSKSVDQLKEMKSHKGVVSKRALDQHLKKMHEDVNHTITDLDKQRKAYHEEEHLAKKTRDQEEKLKKKKAGLFSKLTDLQTKKEKTASQREATEIQSTQARNEYIMSLAATNAHLHHFFSLDIPALISHLDDEVLDKARDIILSLVGTDLNLLTSYREGVTKANKLVEMTSSDFTTAAFFMDPTSACLREELRIDFEPCDNDNVTTVSTEYNAELALQHDLTKWLSCFQKECRNICRLTNQLVKCQTLQSQGHKTVEVRGVGQVNLEAQIDEVRQQLRKCNTSKEKAKARLLAIKESGIFVDDLDAHENKIKSEMKMATLDVEGANQALSRTPSMKSSTVSGAEDSRTDSRSPYGQRSISEEEQPTPEPEQYVGDYDASYESDERGETPYQDNYQQQQQQNWAETGGWGADTGYCTGDAWGGGRGDVPEVSVSQPEDNEAAADFKEDQGFNANFDDTQLAPRYDENYGRQDEQQASQSEEYTAPAVDGTQLVGKVCRAVYPYQAQNSDELDLNEEEVVTVISASDVDWVSGQNGNGQVGYIPAAYLEVIGDAPPAADYDDIQTTETKFDADFGGPDSTIPLPQPDIDALSGQTGDAGDLLEEEDIVKALYDYEATNDEEISFAEGDLILIIERSEDGWWTGERKKDGKKGHFPSMLVGELDEEGDEGEEEGDEEEGEEEEGEEDEGAFGSSGGSAGGSGGGGSPPGGPPPAFAPPKPIHLIPQQIVIMQPTPEIESRGTFGEGEEQDQVNETAKEEPAPQPANQQDNNNNVVERKEPPPPLPPAVTTQNPDFTLEKPSRQPNAEPPPSSDDLPPPPEEETAASPLPPGKGDSLDEEELPPPVEEQEPPTQLSQQEETREELPPPPLPEPPKQQEPPPPPPPPAIQEKFETLIERKKSVTFDEKEAQVISDKQESVDQEDSTMTTEPPKTEDMTGEAGVLDEKEETGKEDDDDESSTESRSLTKSKSSSSSTETEVEVNPPVDTDDEEEELDDDKRVVPPPPGELGIPKEDSMEDLK